MTQSQAGGQPSTRGVVLAGYSYTGLCTAGGQRADGLAAEKLTLDSDRGQKMERRARETMSDERADRLVAMFDFGGGE